MTPSLVSALDTPTILRALSGDSATIAQLYAAYHPQILRLARRALERFGLAEAPAELAAEIWLRLLDHDRRALRAFDPSRASFEVFLAMVARQHGHKIAARWQHRRRREACDLAGCLLEPPTPCAITALHQRQLLRCMLAEAQPRLSALELTVVEEALLWQTPISELAPRLGLGLNALYKRSDRLRARLRDAARRLDHAPLPCIA